MVGRCKPFTIFIGDIIHRGQMVSPLKFRRFRIRILIWSPFLLRAKPEPGGRILLRFSPVPKKNCVIYRIKSLQGALRLVTNVKQTTIPWFSKACEHVRNQCTTKMPREIKEQETCHRDSNSESEYCCLR